MKLFVINLLSTIFTFVRVLMTLSKRGDGRPKKQVAVHKKMVERTIIMQEVIGREENTVGEKEGDEDNQEHSSFGISKEKTTKNAGEEGGKSAITGERGGD